MATDEGAGRKLVFSVVGVGEHRRLRQRSPEPPGKGWATAAVLAVLVLLSLNYVRNFQRRPLRPVAEPVFGSQAQGLTGPSQSVVLVNRGRSTLEVGEVVLLGSYSDDFEITAETCRGQVLAPGQNCRIDVSFRPAGVGETEALLTVTDLSGNVRASVPLTGVGEQGSVGGIGAVTPPESSPARAPESEVTEQEPVGGIPAATTPEPSPTPAPETEATGWEPVGGIPAVAAPEPSSPAAPPREARISRGPTLKTKVEPVPVQGKSGTVVLLATIKADGAVEVERVRKGPRALRENAVAAVEKWRFEPGLRAGQPSDWPLEITVQFNTAREGSR